MNFYNKGYTKGEIAVIVFIIVTLALLTGFVLSFWRKGANDAKRSADLTKIKSVLELYYNKHFEYPATLFDLVDEGFLDSLPLPPPGIGPKEYTYIPLGDNNFCTNYHIGAVMEISSSNYLKGDKDSYKKKVCAKALTEDFDGTATNCSPTGIPQGIKADMCYDLEAI